MADKTNKEKQTKKETTIQRECASTSGVRNKKRARRQPFKTSSPSYCTRRDCPWVPGKNY